MSTQNLNVEGANSEDYNDSNETESKNTTVPIYELTNAIEKSLDDLQNKVQANEKDFMKAIDAIEKKLKEFED